MGERIYRSGEMSPYLRSLAKKPLTCPRCDHVMAVEVDGLDPNRAWWCCDHCGFTERVKVPESALVKVASPTAKEYAEADRRSQELMEHRCRMVPHWKEVVDDIDAKKRPWRKHSLFGKTMQTKLQESNAARREEMGRSDDAENAGEGTGDARGFHVISFEDLRRGDS